MSFALPIALTLSALALPIIALYILKVRLRRVSVSTNLFWKQIYDEKPPRSIWQHFRHLASLLAQLAILGLIVVSLADPFFSWQLLQSRRVVIVVDRSASMRSKDVSPSRFEAARNAARDVVNGLRFRDELAVVLADRRPEVAIGMTDHLPTLHRVIDEIRVTDGPAELDLAVDLAGQLLGDHPRGQVIVLTDGCSRNDQAIASEASPQSLRRIELQADNLSTGPANTSTQVPSHVAYRIFGSEAGNIGITQFQPRRSLVDPIGYEILVGVTNASSHAVRLRLEVTLNDVPVDVIPLTLKPEEHWSRSLEKTSLEGGHVKAMLTEIQTDSGAESVQENATAVGTSGESQGINHLTTDDTAWGILPTREVQDVLIVTPGNLFLQKVFEANPLVRVKVVRELPESFPSNGIVVLHQMLPAVIPPGNVLIIDPVSGCDLWDIGEVIENPIVTDQDPDSELMTHIRLDNVLVPEARQLKFVTPPVVLAGTLSGDAVYAEVKRPSGKCLVLSVNLERSDLTFRTAFPIMMANSLAWFSGQTGELAQAIGSGGMTRVSLNRDAWDASREGDEGSADIQKPLSLNLVAPSGIVTKVRAVEDFVSLGPLQEVGIWTLEPPSQSKQSFSAEGAVVNSDAARADVSPGAATEVAVNLSNEAESDLRTPASLLAAPADPAFVTAWLGRPLWFYLICAAVLLTTLEWLLYQRRLIT